MGYKEIKLLKQSDKGTVHLVQEETGEARFVRKKLKGQHPIYSKLQSLTHPNLPQVYEAVLSEDSTTVIEEYIEGKPLGQIAKAADKSSGEYYNNAVVTTEGIENAVPVAPLS